MFFHLILSVLGSNIVLAASLPQRPERIGSLETAPISSSNLLSPAILAPSSSNTSSGNTLKVGCDSNRFGKNLKVNSCRNVFRYLRKDEKQLTFADRDSGVPFDVPLPLRTYSSEKPSIDASPSWIGCPATLPASTVDLTLTHQQQTTAYASSSQS